MAGRPIGDAESKRKIINDNQKDVEIEIGLWDVGVRALGVKAKDNK